MIRSFDRTTFARDIKGLTATERSNGEMACRSLSDKALSWWNGTDLTVYEIQGEDDTRGYIIKDHNNFFTDSVLSFEGFNKMCEEIADEYADEEE